jgi:molecular chaperone DnaK
MGKINGIHLGTTNSVVALMERASPNVIANSEGYRTTPSMVAFTKNDERIVGEAAKRQAVTNPHKTIYSIKRFMGRRLDEIGEETKLVPFKVQPSTDGNSVRLDIDGKLYSPPEISAMVLQKMKQTAEDYLGQKVTEAVITVPAYLTMPSVRQQKMPAKLQDLPLKELLTNQPLLLLLTVWIKKVKTLQLLFMTWVAVLSIFPFWKLVKAFLK